MLSKFVGTTGKTLIAAIENLMLKGMGPYIIPVIYVLQKSGTTVARWFTWAGLFVKNNLGMPWLSKQVAPATEYISEIVKKLIIKAKPNQATMPGLVSPLGKGGYLLGRTIASLVPSATLRTAGALTAKINPAVWGKLSNLSAQEVGLFAGQTLEQGTFKAIDKIINAEFKEKPTHMALQWVDKNFGTAYSDAYLAYLGGKKMFKYQNGKYISAIENTANAIKDQSNPFLYSNKKAQDIIQGIGKIAGT